MLEDDKLMRLTEAGVQELLRMMEAALRDRAEEVNKYIRAVEDAENHW